MVKILQDAELPSNTTVESTNEGDEHNDVFVPYVDEANVETDPTDSFGESSSLSSNASADDDVAAAAAPVVYADAFYLNL